MPAWMAARVGSRALVRTRLMGQPDLFAKHTFAQETAALTRGAVTWKDPPEISLTHVQGDGRLLVRRSARLPRLDPPWSYVRGHDEIQLEIKMVQYTAMSISARAQVIKSIEVEDAEVVARQRHLVQLLIAQHPEFQEELNAAQRKEGRKEGRRKGRLAEARIILQRVLARRG